MAVAMDLPDDESPTGDIHPRDKTTVADRLILGARALVYKEKVVFQGPIVKRCVLIKDKTNYLVKIIFRGAGKQGIVLQNKTGFEVWYLLHSIT